MVNSAVPGMAVTCCALLLCVHTGLSKQVDVEPLFCLIFGTVAHIRTHIPCTSNANVHVHVLMHTGVHAHVGAFGSKPLLSGKTTLPRGGGGVGTRPRAYPGGGGVRPKKI